MKRNSPQAVRSLVSTTRLTRRSRASRYATSCSTVMNLRSCSLAMTSSSSRRAIVPSSSRISQMTPVGANPARRARSTAASVWPTRRSTPPRRARRGKMCPGPPEVVGDRLRVGQHLYGLRPVVRGDPRCDSEAAVGVHGNGERGTLRVGAALGHERKLQGVRALRGHRDADESAPELGHEVHEFGGDLLGRADQVALVLPVFVVGNDHEPARGNVADRGGNGIKRHGCGCLSRQAIPRPR